MAGGTATEKDRWQNLSLCGFRSCAPRCLARRRFLNSARHSLSARLGKVGVTAATDGDPLGKRPKEAERVLRIGIDAQVNELVTTNENDRAHLVFHDGSSLTVGPNAHC